MPKLGLVEKARKIGWPTVTIGAIDWFSRYQLIRDLLSKLVGYRVAAALSTSWLSPVILVAGLVLLLLSRLHAHSASVESTIEHKPRLLVPYKGFYSVMAHFDSRPDIQFWALHLKFKNDPVSADGNSEAKNVSATIRFFDSHHKELFAIDGRWADGKYPTPTTPKADIGPADFTIGQTRDLDIALKYPSELDCYAVNNESFERNPGHLTLNEYKLVGTDLAAEIRLRGPLVDSKWKIKFRNLGVGQGFEIIDCHSV